MKQQIRSGVFETNSSSVHTIVIRHKRNFNFNLNCHNNIVIAECHDYSTVGSERPYTINSQQEKLEYLISWIVASYETDAKDSWEVDHILSAIRLVNPNVNGIHIQKEELAQFDHQMHPRWNSCVIDLYNVNAIHNFIFNDEITLDCYFD